MKPGHVRLVEMLITIELRDELFVTFGSSYIFAAAPLVPRA